MAKTVHIDPFPDDIDRVAFGHWLSGFADGEGSFILKAPSGSRKWAAAEFRIGLRDDDVDVLYLAQSFLGCGGLAFYSNARSKITNAKPVAVFQVTTTSHLASFVIPHFESFPLRAKKKKDFEFWKQGVMILDSVRRREKPRGVGQ